MMALRRIMLCLVLFLMAASFTACSKALVDGKITAFEGVSRVFDCDANKAYYAVRWAIQQEGYPVANENLVDGVLETDWIPTKSDSHYIAPFGRRDFGANAAYHQVVVNISPVSGGKTKVEVLTKINAVFAHGKTSLVQENKVLSRIADYLRDPNITVTNLGVEE